MYRAKDQGKNNFQFHSPQMNARSLEYVVLERSLRRAIELDEFMVHFQPQFDLTDGRIVGAEALLRWNLPEVGMIPPVKFIPLAEETGLIVPIGRLVLMRACMAAKKWQESGFSNIRVAVNLSPRQFNQSELVIDIINILKDTGLPPENLELEITESMVMANPEGATAILRELRAVGVHLAIDDFGTGYSSLSRLNALPIQMFKIDRCFVQQIGHAFTPSDQLLRTLNTLLVTAKSAGYALDDNKTLAVPNESKITRVTKDHVATLSLDRIDNEGAAIERKLPSVGLSRLRIRTTA
jgi:EAL domain-containing protein (putative c-di-GMP-specific phosphodiesterase class I)